MTSLLQTMGIFNKLFGASNNPNSQRSGTAAIDGIAAPTGALGMRELARVDLGSDDDDGLGQDDMVLPNMLYNYFNKVEFDLVTDNSFVITSADPGPQSLGQIKELFDDLNKEFGPDGHGDGAFDAKDVSQWETRRNVARRFYFYGDNLAVQRFSKDRPWSDDDFLNKPSLFVEVRRDVTDPLYACNITIQFWDKIKERYMS